MSSAAIAHTPSPQGIEHHEMIVDLFAGGGGASTAIHMATGRHPDVAVNHSPDAVALHAMNHPTTRHYCCDVFEVNPVEACADRHGNVRPVGLLWASPDCTHHSKARGGKPAEKKIRALAWVVVKWVSALRRATGRGPRCIFLENVEEFQDWGPLGLDNRPIKERRGETFKLWVSQLEALGYQVEWRELVAADYGAPTTRKRLFLIARCDGRPIQWPEPTHAPRSKIERPDLFSAPLKPWRPAADIIDWTRPTPSIFGRKKELAPKTRKRIAKGIKRFVIEAKTPFVVPVVNAGWNPERSWPATEPLRTVTASKGGDYALVAPTLVGSAYGDDRPGAGLRAWPVDDPARTVTSSGAGGFNLAAAHLMRFMGESEGRDVQEPSPTVTANSFVKRPGGASPIGVAISHITKFSENSTGTDPADPMHTAMAGAPRHGLVTAYLGRQFGSTVSGRDLNDPHPTVVTDGGGGKSQLIAPCLTSYYGQGIGAAMDGPMPTVVTKDRHAPTCAYLEQAKTGVIGHAAEEPVSTILAAGCHQRPVEVALEDQQAEATSRRAEVLRFLWDHFGEPTEAERADPAATPNGRLLYGLVIIGGVVWQISDIGMRMLTPNELYGAQGFPADYIIDHTARGPLTKTAQTRMAGNSVSPPPAAAMIAANDPLLERERVAA